MEEKQQDAESTSISAELPEKSSLPEILNFVAVLVFFAFIVIILETWPKESDGLQDYIFSIIWFSAGLIQMFFLMALSSIIKLLDSIKENTNSTNQ